MPSNHKPRPPEVAKGPQRLDIARFAPATRRRLSAPALRTFLAIADLWGLADTGFGLESWLKRVDLTISGQVPGRYASDGDPSGALAGETVVFTGKLEISRGKAAKAATEMGCSVADSVNRRTTILVVGDQDLRRTRGNEKSSKHRKAEEMIATGAPIRIVGESDFMLMVG